MYKIFTIVIIFLLSNNLIGQEVTGDWYGTLDIGGPKFDLTLHVHDSLGYYQSILDSPKQGAFGMKVDTTIIEQDSMTFLIDTIGVSFKGHISPQRKRITGKFFQNGFSFDLILSREKKETNPNIRPQDPITINYYEEEVVFANYKDSVILAGTLTMPFDPNIKKTVILLTGSGPQNRNEEIPGLNHRPFLVLSDYLTKKGIAVLRYDDRGVGESSGSFGGATTADFARDAKAAIDYIKSRSDLEGTQIGLIGHSEGGIIASLIGDAADFNVLLATPSVLGAELLLNQSAKLAQVQGIPDSIVRLNYSLNARMYNYLLKNPGLSNEKLADSLAIIFKMGIESYPEEAKKGIPDLDKLAMNQGKSLANNWFRFFLKLNPGAFMTKLNNPVLAITGTLDTQVPYEQNLPPMEAALVDESKPLNEVFAFQGLNHMFQAAITGSSSEYSLLTETFNAEVMEIIAAWILKLP